MGGRGGSSSVSRERMLADFDSLLFVQGQLGPEQQIQRGIRAIVVNPNEYVNLAQLRAQLPEMAKSQFDRTLRGLLDRNILQAKPGGDGSGGLDYNGEDIHLIRVRR